MTNDALKPCPFCGGDADIDEFEGKLLETVFAASCNNDDCPIGHKDHGSWPTKTDALNSWNTRAALAPVDVERLKDWISEATSIFEHIIHDLRDNQDLSHKDFRIKVSEMAHDYLSHNHIRHLAARGCFGVLEGFNIGDIVQVSPNCEYYEDWKGVELEIVGIYRQRRIGYITENTPPPICYSVKDVKDSWTYGFTDDFSSDDLIAAAPKKEG